RVDPARDADDHLAEAVLRHVVGEAELEREAHALELVLERRRRRMHRGPTLLPRGQLHDPRLRQSVPLAGKRARPHVPEPAPDRLRRLHVDHEQRLLEPRGACHDLALVVDDDRVAVEDELVLGADGVDERDEARVVARANDEHLLALAFLADVEGRGRDVRDQVRPGEHEIRRRRAGLPEVLANSRPDERLAEAEQHELPAGREVAVLVEDAVIREEALRVDGSELPAGAHCAGVDEVAVEERAADERGDSVRLGGDALERAARLADERRAEKQVLRGVARDAELREEDEVRAGVARLCEPAEDPLAVSVEVADGGVDLREGEPHAPIIQVCDSRAKTLRIPRTRSHAARAARSTRVAHPAPPRPPPPYPTLWVGSRGPPTTRYRLYP